MTPKKQATVKVIHGANDGTFELTGYNVAEVRECLADAFNISQDFVAFVNGRNVESDCKLQSGDVVEFCKRSGSKGIRRMFSRTDIIGHYHGVPDEVLADLFQNLQHDDTNRQGEPLWYEVAVDSWLDGFFKRKSEDDGSDRVMPPNRARLGGVFIDDLTQNEFNLLNALFSDSAGRPAKPTKIASVIMAIYGVHSDETEDKKPALIQAIKRLNKKFTKNGCNSVVVIENRYVLLRSID